VKTAEPVPGGTTFEPGSSGGFVSPYMKPPATDPGPKQQASPDPEPPQAIPAG
jgi:hypothetical protein